MANIKIHTDTLKTAFYFHRKNKLVEAAALYSAVLAEDPNNIHAKHYLGITHMQTGNVELGRQMVNQSIEHSSSYPEAIHNLSVFGKSADAKICQEIDSIPPDEQYKCRANGTVGAWRMERMMDFATVFAGQKYSWLTIGDAYGHDAQILRDKGIEDVHASNLDQRNLEEGARQGVVKEYSQINAESIGFNNNHFDFVLCKEALHHMPRPYIAIYEMLRVAKVGIVLIEPSDPLIDYMKPAGAKVERFLEDKEQNAYVNKKIAYKKIGEGGEEHITDTFLDWYEDGAFNYVYTLSRREVAKISFGMGLPAHAIKSFNDLYVAEINDFQIESVSEQFGSLNEQLKIQDWFCKISGKPPNYVSAILFKETPNKEAMKALNTIGYEIQLTPTIFMPIKFVEL
jgi:SAM-dependent methyltransferase